MHPVGENTEMLFPQGRPLEKGNLGCVCESAGLVGFSPGQQSPAFLMSLLLKMYYRHVCFRLVGYSVHLFGVKECGVFIVTLKLSQGL